MKAADAGHSQQPPPPPIERPQWPLDRSLTMPLDRAFAHDLAELLLLLTRGAVIPRIRAAHLLDRLNAEIRHAQQETVK